MERVIDVSVAGIDIFWESSDAEYDALKENLDNAGFGHLLIEKKSPRAALNDALQRVWPNRRGAGQGRILRPLGPKAVGYGVYQERIQDDGISIQHVELVKVMVEEDSSLVFFGDNFEALDEKQQAAIEILTTTWYREELGKVSHNQITKIFVRCLDSLGGIRLVKRGGMYWLNQDRVEEWCSFFPCVADAACNPGSIVVFRQNVIMDEDGWNATSHALQSEIHSTLDTIQERLESGEVKKRGLKSLQAQAATLHSKIEAYENMFGRVLTELHEAADKAEETATLAVIELEASES